MASSRDTSNGPDWRDVVRAGLELSSVWEVPFTVTMVLTGTAKSPEMVLEAETTAEAPENGGARPSGCARVSMRSGVAGSLEAGLLRLLYELDADIYRKDEGMQGLG